MLHLLHQASRNCVQAQKTQQVTSPSYTETKSCDLPSLSLEAEANNSFKLPNK